MVPPTLKNAIREASVSACLSVRLPRCTPAPGLARTGSFSGIPGFRVALTVFVERSEIPAYAPGVRGDLLSYPCPRVRLPRHMCRNFSQKIIDLELF